MALTTPRLSVVVPCSRPELLAVALAPFAAVGAEVVEIVVAGDVDGVDPAELPVGTTLVPVVPRHANTRRNAALARTTAPRIAFLDDDAVPRPGWLEAALAADPSIPRSSPAPRCRRAAQRRPASPTP